MDDFLSDQYASLREKTTHGACSGKPAQLAVNVVQKEEQVSVCDLVFSLE